MSYIITATIYLGEEANSSKAVDLLLKESRIRMLRRSEDDDTVTLDMSSSFDTRGEDTRWFCNKLIDAGVLAFDIEHS